MKNTLALLLVSMLAPLVGAATLDDIRFAELPNQRFEVQLTFSDAPPEPEGYTIESPARIVLDFPEVVSKLAERRYPLAFDNGNSALVLTSGERTRLIINLERLSSYNARVEGNTYFVEVGAGSSELKVSNRKTETATAVEQSKGGDVGGEREISAVDFRRGEDGEGRIIVDLSDSTISADMRDTSEGLRVRFSNTFVAQALRRRLDVIDFATPVHLISVDNDSGDAVINVKAEGDYDYLAYQTGNRYVVSVKPLTEREKAEQERLFEYTGARLSFNFQDIEVRAVLQIIADFTDLNLVASDTVQGRITLRLDNVPWDQALDMVLKTKGLDKRQEGNVLMVAPAAEIAERERQELSTKRQLEELAPLRTEYIRISYASAEEVFNIAMGGESGNRRDSNRGATYSLMSERGHAVVDQRTNSIIITDTADRVEAFKRLLEEIDVPIKQVMIEARLVIANKDFREELGVRWGGVGASLTSDALFEVGGSTSGLDSSPGSPADFIYGGGSMNLNENMMVDLGVANPVGSIAFGLLTDNTYLDLELSAMEYNGYAEIVSQPKVVTGDKQQAVISTGSEIPYQEASASGATAASFKEVLLELDVTPQITPDNNIIMDLIIKKDLLAEFNQEFGVPIIDVTHVQTKVLVNDGQTIVLGGIFEMEQLKGIDKVPFLGDIPYLGRLFRRDTVATEKSELLVFITPRIMSDELTD
ncbi:type IV pilus secretin PilQ family protein [Gilvimarinus sp. SDUM040013]|uniref:Type IV pilus secretin PilQ family protein n=1 Tax=Gilvimarinus gilvus TaxID=3058038 RepID=A0ABU4S217_9GAMM|nr:type IV pilus secretin PilQ family protein [Gilvimarinus sp. SDUM040013]MDO3387386.1 type IV pilus secretin PilQ family protein [Gilvimarinus sp. SDUM040013]MDX6849863.1 type IV pilus secretin PilQ family protein [Gilvimarinus sp. SDUM040013]